MSGHPTLRYERKLWREGVRVVAGVDEAGVGPMAGPVVAAAVIFAQEIFIRGVNDSKQLPPERREALFPRIRKRRSRSESESPPQARSTNSTSFGRRWRRARAPCRR